VLGLHQAVGGEPAAQALERDEQVALTGHTQLGHGERERGGGGGAPRVVVAAAADDDAHPVAQIQRQRIEVVSPHRTRQRAARVAQLEVDAHASRPEPPHLALELNASELTQAALELRGVDADRIGPRETAVLDALGDGGFGRAHRLGRG
jgi:hypothetical protein